MPKYDFGKGIPTWDGIPMIGNFPAGITNCFFVDYGNGSDSVSVKSNSVNRPWKTIEYAETKITTNKNEGIALMGNSTHTLSAILTIDKNRMHIFGYDPGGRMYGQNAKISLGSTVVATDIATILNTGVRNSFSNIKIINENDVAEGLYAFAEGGEYTVFNFCEFYKTTQLDIALAAELLCNGDSSQWNYCVFGDLVNQKGDTNDERPCVLLTRETITGKVARDCEFNFCEFLTKAATTATACIHSTTATDVERRMILRKPIFMNAILGAADPAAAISLDAAQTQGKILVIDPTYLDITALATSNMGVYVSGGSVPADPTTGKAVAVDGA
jgi:hypothetical protein